MKGAPPQIPGLVHVQPLGSGGYADVFLYEQQSPRMPVAVKVLKGEGLTDALRSQFVEEADTMAALGDHPYIVQVFRSGAADDGRPYLVMKYYPPPNLAMRARADRFSVEEVLRMGIQLASAVETAHRASITHRDIKPANVLISAYGAPGLTDFGIAGRGGRDGDGPEIESTDDIGVSVPWAPPEVLYGQSNGDVRSDVYSLAATLWQLLVGRSPFEVPGGDNSAYALMPRIRRTPVPSTGRQDVPTGLERLLAQAMAKDPRSRPATALEFARALQSVEQHQRLARTPIVVLDEQGHTTLVSQTFGSPVGRDDDDDRTRIKAPQTVIAQPSPTLLDDETRRRPTSPASRSAPAPAGTSGSAAGAGPVAGTSGSAAGPGPVAGSSSVGWSSSSPPVRASARTDPTTSNTSPLASDLAEETTVRRGSVAAGQPAPALPAPGSTGLGNPVILWGLVAGVAILLGLVAFLVLRPTQSGPVDPAAVAPKASPTVQMPGDDSAIGNGVFERPTVRAEAGPGRVTFSWTYPSPARTDTFVISVGPTSSEANKDPGTRVTTTTRTVKVAKGAQVCAYVKVVRAGQTSPASDPTCDTAL